MTAQTRVGTFAITRSDVEALRYLNDPRKAALYLGVPQVQVEDVWAEMPEARSNHSGKIEYRRRKSAVNTADYRETGKPSAESASLELKNAILGVFIRLADEEGVTVDEVAAVQLSGRLAQHRNEERELLKRVEAESRAREWQ